MQLYTNYKQVKAKIASKTFPIIFIKTFDSFVFPYINSNILYYIHLFCIFVIDLFSNVLHSFECLIFPNIR